MKHEGYHNVKCISKELGYRDNRGTRGHRYFIEFLPTWSTSRLERGWYQTTNATKGLPYSPVNLTPMGSIHASTIGALVGGNRNLSQGWGTTPQLNWRLPTNATKGLNKCHQGHNATKATKPSRVPRTQEGQAPMSNSNQILRGEHKPMHRMQMARTQEVLKSFSPKFHQSYKSLWGNKRGRTMEEIHKRLQDLDPNMFPSLRGEIDWWDCRSRSPLSNPSRICKNHRRD